MWKKIIILMFLFVSVTHATISCSVSTSCSGTTILKISDIINAHAGLANTSNYPYAVCCSELVGSLINSSCSGTYANLVDLSDTNNAHGAEHTAGTYAISVCLQTDLASVGVEYISGGCGSQDTCLFSLSDITNAHFGNCTAYNIRVCASTGQKAPTSSSGGITGTGDVTGNATNITTTTAINTVPPVVATFVGTPNATLTESLEILNSPCEYNGSLEFELKVKNNGNISQIINITSWITTANGDNLQKINESIYSRAKLQIIMRKALQSNTYSAWHTLNVNVIADNESAFARTHFWIEKCINGKPVNDPMQITRKILFSRIGGIVMWQIFMIIIIGNTVFFTLAGKPFGEPRKVKAFPTTIFTVVMMLALAASAA